MSVPLTTPVPNPAIPQPQDQTRQWDAGSTGNTLLDLLARLKEHADAADAAIANAHAHPSLQNDAGAFKDTVLGTLLGLPLEAMDTGSKMLTGAALSTLGNLTPHIASNVPVLGGISDMAHQASDAPMRQDPFQDLLARNQAAAAGHGFQVGVINALLNPGNLLGGEGAGAHAFEAGATTLPTIAEHAASLAKQAGKGKVAADFMEQAAQALAQGKPLSDVLASAMQATGKSLGDLTPADKLAAIPADSPFAQHLRGLIAAPGPGGQQALPLVGDAATGTPAAIADILAQTPKPPIDNTQAALQMAVGQGATPTAADIQKALGVGMVEAGRLQDAASGAATKAGDLVAPADKAISPETSALIDKVAPDNPAAPMSTLDRMDALSGPPLRQLLDDLLTITYDRGAKKALNSITGAGATFGPDSRLMQNGEDVTRSLLDYLLQRDSLSPAERDALQARLFPESKVGQAAAQQAGKDAVAGMSPADAMAQIDQPDSADALDAMRNFILHGRGDNGMPALPGNADFYSKRVPGITDQQVPSLLKQLQGEGTLGYDARQGYMVRPNDARPPGLTEATSVTDGAGNPISQFTPQALDPRAAWQQNYVNQSQAGTDLLAQGGKVAGSDVTQGSMNAMAPADRMAMLQKLAGGDTPAAQTPVIAADAPGALGALPANNYRTTLSTYTDRLYRESDISEAMSVLDPARNGDGGGAGLYFSNTPDLATGQGANRGVMIQYDPALIQGQVNTSKPVWQPSWQSGAAEFVDKLGRPGTLTDAVRSVTVDPTALGGTPGMRTRFTRTMNNLVNQGWQREALADGKVRYTPPDAGTATQTLAPVGAVPAVPAAQTPALEAVAQVAAKAPEVAPQAVPPERIIQHIANETVPPPEEIASIVADPTPPADLLNRHVETQHSTDLFSDAADVPPKGGPPRGIMGLLPQVTQGGTTASGGLIGGIAGYQAGNGDGKDPLAGITGGIAGAAIGAGLGNRAFTPAGEQTIKFFGAVAQEMVAAEQNALENGTKKFTFKTIGDQWSQQQIQSPKNVIEEVLSNTLFMLRTGVSYGKAKANFTDLANLYTAGQRDANKLVTTVAKDMHTALGVPDYVPNLGGGAGVQLGYHSETVAHPVQSAINNAILTTATPASVATSALTGGVPVAGVVYGFARGLIQPALTAAYEAFDSIVKAAFRSAVYEDALAKQVASDAAPFLQKVQQLTGTVPAALPQSGMFSADTIRTALAQAPSGVADALANEWALTSKQALDTAASFSRQTFGDFSNIHGFEKFVRAAVPFSSFIIRAIPRTIELVQDHPAIAAAATTQLIADGQRATQEGRSSSQVGGIPVDSNTPLIGKLADMQTGGRGGVAHINLLNGILPIPTGVFGGMGLDTSGQDAPVYDPSGKMIDQGSNQKGLQLLYMQAADAIEHAGFSVNPVIQMVAYAANWDFKRPGSLSKDAGLEQALPGPRIGSAYTGLDFIRQNVGGGTVNNTTAGDKVLGQLFYDKYGMSMADPRAAKLVAQTMQPGNELVQQAQSIANKAALSRDTLGEVLPSSVQGQTQHELDIQRAQGDQSRVNAALIAQAQADPQGFQDFMAQLQQRQMMIQNLQRNYPVQYQQLLAQGQTPIKGANPIYGQLVAPQNTSPLLITQGTDAQHRAQQASLAWQQEHQTLGYLAPTVYQAQLAALHNALGLPSQP